jgi:ABC-2 type transport system ATP-binding protein
MIEKPSLYEHFTVYQQLKYLDILFSKGNKRIEEILFLTGLKNEKNKKIKHLSTGMKQRLGIGMALFHDPEILILDEPVNGLDPEGVYNIRQLLLHLQEIGKTIILSSHILSEIEKTCSHIGILNKGKLIFQGEMKEMIASVQKKVTVVYCSDVLKAFNTLHKEKIKADMPNEECVCFYIQNGYEFNNVLNILIKEVEIFNIETMSDTLEDLFINLTSDEE